MSTKGFISYIYISIEWQKAMDNWRESDLQLQQKWMNFSALFLSCCLATTVCSFNLCDCIKWITHRNRRPTTLNAHCAHRLHCLSTLLNVGPYSHRRARREGEMLMTLVGQRACRLSILKVRGFSTPPMQTLAVQSNSQDTQHSKLKLGIIPFYGRNHYVSRKSSLTVKVLPLKMLQHETRAGKN